MSAKQFTLVLINMSAYDPKRTFHSVFRMTIKTDFPVKNRVESEIIF